MTTSLNRHLGATSFITVEGLTVYRGVRAVVDHLSFRMQTGGVFGVLGANGAGKTSLLQALSGECPYAKGWVRLDKQSIATMTPQVLATRRAVLPQHATLTFSLEVEEVIRMGGYPFPHISPGQIEQWVNTALKDVELVHRRHSAYPELSGGEQQRVQFARVLVQARAIAHAQGHAWIFLDEPTASLDPKHQQMVMQKVHQLTREENFGVMVVMHDLNLASRWCDRLMLMKAGGLVVDGVVAKALTAEHLLECFDIPMQVMSHPKRSGELIVLVEQ